MIRRHFMAMLGFAPAAAAVAKSSPLPLPAEPMPSASGILAAGSDVFGEGVANVASAEDHSPIEHARRNLDALLWAKKTGLPDNHFSLGAPPAVHIHAMQSWSPTTKARLAREYEARYHEEQQLLYAQNQLDRAIKLAVAPSWMRRFL